MSPQGDLTERGFEGFCIEITNCDEAVVPMTLVDPVAQPSPRIQPILRAIGPVAWQTALPVVHGEDRGRLAAPEHEFRQDDVPRKCCRLPVFNDVEVGDGGPARATSKDTQTGLVRLRRRLPLDFILSGRKAA